MLLFHFLFLFGQTAVSTEHTEAVARLREDLAVSRQELSATRQELSATRQAMVCLLLLYVLVVGNLRKGDVG